MQVFRFFGRRSTVPQKRATRLQRTRSLRCECLEDRRLLSITVDTLVDEADGSITDGDVSLRDAIAIAPAGETIDFSTSLDGGTILLELGELTITKPVAIDASSLSGDLTIDASGNDPTPNSYPIGDGSRVFTIDDSDDGNEINVILRGLTLTGGDVDGDGGAIHSVENLTLADSIITGNVTQGKGGGIFSRGTIDSISGSSISDNRTSLRGGGGVVSSTRA